MQPFFHYFQKIGFALSNVEPLIKQTKAVLRIYQHLRWVLALRQSDLREELADDGWNSYDIGVTYLLTFAPEIELEVFEAQVCRLVENNLLLAFIDRTILCLKQYPVHGFEYYDVITVQYLSDKNLDEAAILQTLGMERSTFYRKKKEALFLLGLCLFGLAPREMEIQEHEQLSLFAVC